MRGQSRRLILLKNSIDQKGTVKNTTKILRSEVVIEEKFQAANDCS
jgi:hypothetical protein